MGVKWRGSNHWQLDSFLNSMIKLTTMKTSKLHFIWAEKPLVTGGYRTQMVSIWKVFPCHNVIMQKCQENHQCTSRVMLLWESVEIDTCEGGATVTSHTNPFMFKATGGHSWLYTVWTLTPWQGDNVNRVGMMLTHWGWDKMADISQTTICIDDICIFLNKNT